MLILLIIFIIWMVWSWFLAGKILARTFAFDPKINALLAVFLPLFILGPLANIFAAWFILNNWTIILAFLLSWLLMFWGEKALAKSEIMEKSEPIEVEGSKSIGFNFPKWLYGVFGLLVLAGFYLIFNSAIGDRLVSPWDVLKSWQVLVVGILAAIILYAIYCRKISTVMVLTMIIVFSGLLHSYLLVYSNGFGGDRFRHLGSESRILSGLEYQPTLLTANLWFSQLGPLKYPQALTDSAKLSYGTMWSLEVIAAKITNVSVFQINRYLLPILWSIFLTVLMFALAYRLKPDKKFALLCAFLANSFYLFQYYGAQGLPASYGLLWLAGYLLFLLDYVKEPSRRKLWFLVVGLILMYFNYSLAFILLLIFTALSVLLIKKKVVIYPAAVVSIIALIAFDFLSSPHWQFIGWSKILSIWSLGNLIDFNSLNRLVPMIGEWHLLELILLLGFLAILGVKLSKIFWRSDRGWLLVALMIKITLAAYCLSYIFLAGDHLVARRLTLFAILPLVFIFAEALSNFAKNDKRWLMAGVGLVLVTMLTYYSGPALNVSVSNRDLNKATLMWHDLKGKSGYCIKDDEEVILALEYVSAKEFQETINNQNCQAQNLK